LAARVQIHDNEFRVALHETHERVAAGGDFQFHAELLGGFRQLHLKKEIIHQRYDFSHRSGPHDLTSNIMRQF
jgi:hypothetical protein